MTSLIRRGVLAAIGAALALGPITAAAQSDYPNKPIKLIVGFAPGGSTDIVARIVAQKLGEKLGQTVIVENRAGAGGTIGADVTAKSPPDGYTLTLGTTSTHAIAAGAYSKLPYDPVKDFTHVSLVAVTPYLLVVPSVSVYPSGAALAAASAPIVPPAPALFSTTTTCPRRSPSFCATMRATMSVEPPGAKPTMSLMGRLG